MKHVMIQYTIKPDVDLAELESTIATFVDALRSTDDRIIYTSYRASDAERSFVHVGFFPDEDTVKRMQAQPFFGEFSGFLKPRCADGPSVSWLSPVASTTKFAGE